MALCALQQMLLQQLETHDASFCKPAKQIRMPSSCGFSLTAARGALCGMLYVCRYKVVDQSA
eukprot:jgi/Antlo1/1843/1344